MLYAVSIPTRMALEETKDLVAACDRMGIAVPLVLLNLMTPSGDCRLCSSLRRRELLVAESFRQAFPEKQQTLVYRQPELAGLERLEEFGLCLYRARQTGAGQPMTPRETTPGEDRFTPELCALEESERVSICEVLDRVLNKGVVVAGEVTISVADVDLLYLGLNLVLTSVETARESMGNGRAAAGLAIEIGKGKTNGSGRNNAGRV